MMNDALRVEDHKARLRVLFPSRKAEVSAGRENARLPVVAIWRAGTVDARFFVGRRSKAMIAGSTQKLHPKGLI